MSRLFMRDFLTLDLKNADKRLVSCDAEGGSNSLLVRVAATHSGIINGNMRFYRPDKMMAGTSTWLDNYPRPVLTHHNEDGDPVGRVLEAKYVDLSHLYKAEYPILNDSVFYCSDAKKRMNTMETVDWVVDNLGKLKGFKGLGYIELGLKITSPDAIAKALRKEYLNVSVGFSTDSAVCSICHQDWATDDKCDHELGSMYDGKLAFIVSGSHTYSECSYVNSPADPFATTLSIEKLTDSLNRAFFLGLPSDEQQRRATAAGLVLTDALYSADIERVEDITEMVDLKALDAEIKSPSLSAERALAIKLELADHKAESDAGKKLTKKLFSTVTAKIKANGWGSAAVSADSAQANTEIAAIPVVDASETAVLNAELIAADAAAAAKPPEVAPVPLTDALLQLSDALKAIFAAAEMKDANESIVTTVKALDAAWDGLEGSNRRYLRYAVSALTSTWYAKEDLADYLGYLTKDTDSVITTQAEQDTLTDAIASFDATEKDLKDACAVEEGQKLRILKQCKDALATTIVLHKVLTGKAGFQGQTPTQIADHIAKRAARDLTSLLDMRDEILEELQWAKPVQAAVAATSTAQASAAGALEVSDAVQSPEAIAAAAAAAPPAGTPVIENKDSLEAKEAAVLANVSQKFDRMDRFAAARQRARAAALAE